MQKIESITRDNISDSVAVALRNMIVDGRLPAGERINEVHLSAQLGVSRTPLREALAMLVLEGALRSIPRIGHFVRDLTLEEFEQIYDIRPLLDPEALRLSGLPSRERMESLRELNDKIERTRYEIALMREHKNVTVATANHRAIMAALRRRDLGAACTALRTNLQTGREPIVKWLVARETRKGGGE